MLWTTTGSKQQEVPRKSKLVNKHIATPITVKNRATSLLQRIDKYYCMHKYSNILGNLRFHVSEYPLGSNRCFLHQCNYVS